MSETCWKCGIRRGDLCRTPKYCARDAKLLAAVKSLPNNTEAEVKPAVNSATFNLEVNSDLAPSGGEGDAEGASQAMTARVSRALAAQVRAAPRPETGDTRYSYTGTPPSIEMCDHGHRFGFLPDHPLVNGGHKLCPHCCAAIAVQREPRP